MLQLGDTDVDNEGMQIEDFGLTHNVMFARYVVAESFEEALQHIRIT